MHKNIYDFDDNDLIINLDGLTGVDLDGNLMMNMGGNMAMDLETGEIHITSGWPDEDDEN